MFVTLHTKSSRLEYGYNEALSWFRWTTIVYTEGTANHYKPYIIFLFWWRLLKAIGYLNRGRLKKSKPVFGRGDSLASRFIGCRQSSACNICADWMN